MENTFHRILYITGLIVFVYLLFRYILPFILTLLGFVISAFFYVIMWVIVGVLFMFLLSHIISLNK